MPKQHPPVEKPSSGLPGRPHLALPGTPLVEHLDLIGGSGAIAKVYAAIARLSRHKTNVLLLGESGTGKELIARALHATGPRQDQVFVPLNCATLGREILENELFGHERGAFTGANETKKGLFEVADGGTLFLDEIGELDLSTQAKLLRVLERHQFRRVGGTTKIKVDLSLVAATNRDLEEAIAAKRFREDLYYRLKVVTIVVPPLRERREDIPALVEAFIRDFNKRNEVQIKGMSARALGQLMEHDWPGNVRELKNAVESAAVMAVGDTIEVTDLEGVATRGRLPAPSRAPTTLGASVFGKSNSGDTLTIPVNMPLAEVERLLIAEQLRRCSTKMEAARVLGIGLRTLYSKIEQLDLQSPPRRRSA